MSGTSCAGRGHRFGTTSTPGRVGNDAPSGTPRSTSRHRSGSVRSCVSSSLVGTLVHGHRAQPPHPGQAGHSWTALQCQVLDMQTRRKGW